MVVKGLNLQYVRNLLLPLPLRAPTLLTASDHCSAHNFNILFLTNFSLAGSTNNIDIC